MGLKQHLWLLCRHCGQLDLRRLIQGWKKWWTIWRMFPPIDQGKLVLPKASSWIGPRLRSTVMNFILMPYDHSRFQRRTNRKCRCWWHHCGFYYLFLSVIAKNIILISRAFRGQFVIPDFTGFTKYIEEFYWKCKSNNSGKVSPKWITKYVPDGV